MKNTFKVFGVIALAAIIGFSFVACGDGGGDGDGGGGGGKIDTAALETAILNASKARNGVKIETTASDVPEGKKWVTPAEWNALDSVYKAAAETKAKPSSQAAVDKAKQDLEAAISVFNAVKKDGSAAAITLSGTITAKNKGKIVPYVQIEAHTEGWAWQEEGIRVPVTGDNTPWEIIIKSFSKSTTVYFDVTGCEDEKFEKKVFSFTVPGLTKTVHNTNVSGIAINLNLNLITISGTLNLDYGEAIPSATIYINKKDDRSGLGSGNIFNVTKNTPWSINIDSQSSETAVYFTVVGFEGPLPWDYAQLFGLWSTETGKDFGGVTVHNSDKSGVALNLIKISGTVNVTYGGQPVHRVVVTIRKQENGEYGVYRIWLADTTLKSPPANTPWSFVIPAYTSETAIDIDIDCYTGEDDSSLVDSTTVTKNVKNTNVSGIAINLALP